MTWLFTCRHTYEPTLLVELNRLGLAADRCRAVLPGVVEADLVETPTHEALTHWDPAYALQVLPDVRRARGVSIAELAKACVAQLPAQWPDWPGRFAVHAFVPGLLKGQPKPALRQRTELLQAAVHKLLMAGPRLPTASRLTQRLVQLLLLSPSEVVVAASPVVHFGRALVWPSLLPAGLANPPDEDDAPNSAFRKLREAFAWLGPPAPGSVVVDLGASPGGWTHVLRRLDCVVTAVDRAPLTAELMADPRVQFVKGDAFGWLPPQPVNGLVSDIIAYPERAAELLEKWCGATAMQWFVVQMKFKGAPDWTALDNARRIAHHHGYLVRARHFFNDKNELTLLGLRREVGDGQG